MAHFSEVQDLVTILCTRPLQSDPCIFYGTIKEEMKVLITEISEPGHWDGALLEMWESPDPSRKEVRALFEAKYQENPATITVGEVKEVMSGIKKVEKTMKSKKKKIVKAEDVESEMKGEIEGGTRHYCEKCF